MCQLCTKDGDTWRHVGRERKPKPVFNPPDPIFSPMTELAWAAGFFDGEGWTSTTKSRATRNGTRTYVQIGVGQALRPPLERLRRAVGVGSITGVPKNGSSYWQWRVSGRTAYEAMEKLWPFLAAPKREQFLTVDAGCD